MKVNLHTHTSRCRHAVGTDEEYVQAAIAAGYKKLGFSDHTPFPYPDDFFNVDKMEMWELGGYISSVRGLKEKYCGQIEILMGLECEPIPEFFPFLRQIADEFDYLILGNHGEKRMEEYYSKTRTKEDLWRYTQLVVEGMKTGLFLYVAHPDLVLNSYPVFDEEAEKMSRLVCREARHLNLPLEYNLNGYAKRHLQTGLGYPCDQFWRIAAEENVCAVVGVDAHRPQAFLDWDLEGAFERLRTLGVKVLEDPMDTKR